MIENWQITNKGFARLKQLIPKYIEERPWNGWLYLTIYDINRPAGFGSQVFGDLKNRPPIAVPPSAG